MMVVPRAEQDPKRPSAPDIPIQYLAMAAATMKQQGRLDQPDGDQGNNIQVAASGQDSGGNDLRRNPEKLTPEQVEMYDKHVANATRSGVKPLPIDQWMPGKMK